MPLGVGKDCFPTPTNCHNCERKGSSRVRKKTVPKEDYKRCASCHIMTYCDKDCQREHWIRVHKKHCKFLSGKVPANNSVHNATNCLRCINEKQASLEEIRSNNSPKTICTTNQINFVMKKGISDAFEFHEEGKKCKCSLQFATELPFTLGEVSGRYMEFDSTGQDAMLAHALNIVSAMVTKAGTAQNRKTTLGELWAEIISERVGLWCQILIFGILKFHDTHHLIDKVDSLKAIYGASNAWWKALKFSVVFVMKTNTDLISNSSDPRGLEDPRFQKVKEMHDYRQSQLKNQALVCEKQLWAKVMLWPVLINGSLHLVLPPGTRCQNCFTELCGKLAIMEEDSATLPYLMPIFASNGALMTSCSYVRNPNCMKICLFKNVFTRMRSEEDGNQYKQLLEEKELFEIECRECDFCLKSSLSSHRCSACLAVQYCSIVCQKKDLDFHKTVCSTWAKDKSRRILGKEKQKDHWKEVVDKYKKGFGK